MSPPAYVIYKNGSSIGSKLLIYSLAWHLCTWVQLQYFFRARANSTIPLCFIFSTLVGGFSDSSMPGILIFSILFALTFANLNLELSISDDNIREFRIVLRALATYQMIEVTIYSCA